MARFKNGVKPCPVCGIPKPEDEYNWRNVAKGWRRPECRACQKLATSRYSEANRPEIRAKINARRAANPGGRKAEHTKRYAKYRQQESDRKRAYRIAHGDELRARARARYEANPEYQAEASRRWLAKNKDRMIAYSHKWYIANIDKVFEKARRRRAKLRGCTIVMFTPKQLDERMSVFGHRCAYCGGSFDEIDHVIPISKGGMHCLSNLRPACQRCNRTKHAKNVHEWTAKKRAATNLPFLENKQCLLPSAFP